MDLVYCSKCGATNEDGAKFCTKCGAPQEITQKKNWEEDLERGAEEFGRRAEKFGKRMENECFGLPYGGAIAGLIFGAFIIIIGVSLAMGIDIGNVLGNSPWIGGAFIVLFGVLIVAGAIYGLTRKRR